MSGSPDEIGFNEEPAEPSDDLMRTWRFFKAALLAEYPEPLDYAWRCLDFSDELHILAENAKTLEGPE